MSIPMNDLISEPLTEFRWHSNRWFFIYSHRNKELRNGFIPQYGINFNLMLGTMPTLSINTYFHRYAAFIRVGRRYSGRHVGVTA